MRRENPYLSWLWGLGVAGIFIGLFSVLITIGEVPFDDERAEILWYFFAGLLFVIGVLSLVAALAVSAMLWRTAPVDPSAVPDDATPLRLDDPPWLPSFAGWYPADRGERYFDGERWTDQVRL